MRNASIRAVKGFLLLEALVAMVLFIAGVTTVVYYHSKSIQMQGDARTRVKALALVANCVEHFKAGSCTLPDVRSEQQSGITLTVHTKPFVDEDLADNNALAELVVQAQWQSSQGVPSTYEVATVIKSAGKR